MTIDLPRLPQSYKISMQARGQREMKVRLWIALMLIRLAGKVAGMSFGVGDGE